MDMTPANTGYSYPTGAIIHLAVLLGNEIGTQAPFRYLPGLVGRGYLIGTRNYR